MSVRNERAGPDSATPGAGYPLPWSVYRWLPGEDATVKLFSGDARAHFQAELDVDEATWARGRGWVLSQALIALSYYTLETNPVLVREAERWLTAALADSP